MGHIIDYSGEFAFNRKLNQEELDYLTNLFRGSNGRNYFNLGADIYSVWKCSQSECADLEEQLNKMLTIFNAEFPHNPITLEGEITAVDGSEISILVFEKGKVVNKDAEVVLTPETAGELSEHIQVLTYALVQFVEDCAGTGTEEAARVEAAFQALKASSLSNVSNEELRAELKRRLYF